MTLTNPHKDPKKIEISEIKANGVMHVPGINLSKYISIIETSIPLYRMRNTDGDIFNKFPDQSLDAYYRGSRFKDNHEVALRAASAVLEYFYNPEVDKEIINEQLEEFFTEIDGKTMDALIQDALRDCAEADRYYTFEKNWN